MDVPLEMGSLVFFHFDYYWIPLGLNSYWLNFFESFKEIEKTKNKDLKLLTIVFFSWTKKGFKGSLKKNNSFLRTKFFFGVAEKRFFYWKKDLFEQSFELT